MKVIKYNRIVQSEAMSKNPNQSGLVVSYRERGGYPTMQKDIIEFQAINPKTNTITSHLSMELPLENIDDLINQLQEIKADLNKK
jgi:hypothetical protein